MYIMEIIWIQRTNSKWSNVWKTKSKKKWHKNCFNGDFDIDNNNNNIHIIYIYKLCTTDVMYSIWQIMMIIPLPSTYTRYDCIIFHTFPIRLRFPGYCCVMYKAIILCNIFIVRVHPIYKNGTVSFPFM